MAEWRLERALRPRWLRPVLVLLTVLLLALVIYRFGLSWELPAYLFLAVVAVVLSLIDLKYQLLPNAIVLRALIIAAVLLLLASLLSLVTTGEFTWEPLLGALFGAGALFILYLILALISPQGLGMGDVKLAALIGLYLGYLGWDAVLLGAFAGFLVGGLAGVVVLLTGRGGRHTAIPFGPSMLAGAFIAIGWAEPLMQLALPAAL